MGASPRLVPSADRAGNPYIGPRPFTRDDYARFFGRDKESAEILSLIKSHRAVLLYAQSGAGKTSLLEAGVLPALEAGGFDVLPFARVSGSDLTGGDEANAFVRNTLASWGEKEGQTLAEALQRRAPRVDRFQNPRPRIVIFDQFEELFTASQGSWREREEFFQQLGDALERQNFLRVLLAIREDYLASLDPYEESLPEDLRARYRIELLRSGAALAAIQKPLAGTGVRFEPGAAETLLENLLGSSAMSRNRTGVRTAREFVEPVQLQVACFNLFRQLPPGTDVINAQQVRSFGDVDLALRQFYEAAILTVMARTGVRENLLRRWFDEELITKDWTRGLVYREQGTTKGLPNAAVDVLDSQHIIRSELRGNSRWYELSHDRLVNAVRHANLDWRIARERNEKRKLRAGIAALTLVLIGILFLLFLVFQQSRQIQHARLQGAAQLLAIHASRLSRQSADAQLGALLARQAYLFHMRDPAQPFDQIDEALTIAGSGWFQSRLTRQHIGSPAMFSPDGAAVAAVDGNKVVIWTEAGALELPHPGAVTALAFSPTGDLIASGCTDGFIRVWPAKRKGEPVKVLKQESSKHIVFSPDGTKLAAACSYGCLQVWNLHDGGDHPLHVDQTGTYSPIAFSSDGGRLIGFSSSATIWDLRQAHAVPEFIRYSYAASVSADGNWIAAAENDHVIRLYNVKSPATPVAAFRGHTEEIRVLRISDNGQTIVSASDDKTVRIWRADRRDPVYTMPWKSGLLALSGDGQLLAFSDGKTLRVEDLRGSQGVLQSLGALGDYAEDLTFAPGGHKLLAPGHDILVWERSDPEMSLLPGAETTAMRYSPDGIRLAVAGADGMVRVWRVGSSGAPELVLKAHKDPAPKPEKKAPVYTPPPGNSVAGLQAWLKQMEEDSLKFHQQMEERQWRMRFGLPPTPTTPIEAPPPISASAVAFSPDGRRLAAGGADMLIRIWDVDQPARESLTISAPNAIRYLAFSPDGKQLAACGNTFVAVVDLGDMRTLLNWQPDNGMEAVEFAPDGKHLIGAGIGAAMFVFDLNNPRNQPLKLHGYDYGHALSPGARRVFSTGSRDEASVWNREPTDFKIALDGMQNPNEQMPGFFGVSAFSPDGNLLAVISDRILHLWDLNHADQKPVWLQGTGDPIDAIAFSPDGKNLAIAGNAIRIWPLPRVRAQRICDKLLRNLTPGEWREYVGPALAYERTCPALPIGKEKDPE